MSPRPAPPLVATTCLGRLRIAARATPAPTPPSPPHRRCVAYPATPPFPAAAPGCGCEDIKDRGLCNTHYEAVKKLKDSIGDAGTLAGEEAWQAALIALSLQLGQLFTA